MKTATFFLLCCLFGSFYFIQQILENTFFVLFNPTEIYDFRKGYSFQTFNDAKLIRLPSSMQKANCR